MLQAKEIKVKNIRHPFDHQDKIMPAAVIAEWFIKYCLREAGLSGYQGPGVSMCILE